MTKTKDILEKYNILRTLLYKRIKDYNTDSFKAK